MLREQDACEACGDCSTLRKASRSKAEADERLRRAHCRRRFFSDLEILIESVSVTIETKVV